MIKRTINLNNIKNKFGSNSELINEETNKFKGIPKDFKIPSSEAIFSLTGLPLSDVYFNEDGVLTACTSNTRILRYRTMVDNYVWLKNFAKNTAFYKLCNRKGQNKWISIDRSLFDVNFNGNGYAVIPPTESTIGTEIFVNSNIVEFNERFNNLKGAKNFKTFVDKHYEESPYTATTIPYITLPISIDVDYDDLGTLQTDINFHQKGKKYHLYDVVIGDNGNSYRLISGGTENGKVKYDKVEVPQKISEIIKTDKTTWDKKKIITSIDSINNIENFILKDGDKYYFIYPYNDSNFNETDWEEITLPDSEEEEITGSTIGYIKTLKRYKSEAFDYMGKSYPFILSAEGKSEIPYILGTPLNMRKVGEGLFCDVITEIKFENSTFTDGIILCESIASSQGKVSFTYLKNSCYDSGSEIKFSGGVEYVEEYPYTKKTVQFKESETESEKSIEYVDIDYSAQNAIFKYDVKPNNNDFLSGITSYRNESLLGMVDIDKNINVSVVRGKSAAFERHNILGEINNFEELQNYKNDYFKIRKNS